MSRASVAIVAALIRDAEGRVLLVRKAGTRAFMQPGGKREVGEDDLAALDRELAEEIGCNMIAGSAVAMGDFVASAANEADRDVAAAVYAVAIAGTAQPYAEIEEILWVDPRHLPDIDLAPLSRDHVLPLASVSK
ncbi:MAG TPA: NUDIX domain-containing protein [Bauldia sp.]